jgi:hypothetical protein
MGDGHLSPEQAEAQMKELVQFYNGINERCFNDCVVNFRTRKLTAGG